MGKYNGTLDAIYDSLLGMYEVDDNMLQGVILRALSLLEQNIIDKVVKKIVFISTSSNTHGLFINHQAKNYKNRSFIIINNLILTFSEKEQIEIVLHEIAHFILKHKNGNDYPIVEQYDLNETQADALVAEWLNKPIKNN